MVHYKLNEKETNPNPHINFITALPSFDDTESESAKQLLRALAAQVRPIMKSHGFYVNSFEEYEHNNVFAGRNWNAGETIEIVLRRSDRTFFPTSWLMSTLCHELAHIKHMNHGPAFQTLWQKLRQEVRALQGKGYFGDGYWSSGKRLSDSSEVSGEGINPGDLPEYMCGGAQTRRRPTTKAPRRRQGHDTTIVASTSTGQQSIRRRKAGSRVNSRTAFRGEGMSLGEGVVDAKGKGKGTGFGKRATSKRAREERASAIERRLISLQTHASPTAEPEAITESESEPEEVRILETDSDRRESLLASGKKEDLDNLKSGVLWEHLEDFSKSSTDNGLKNGHETLTASSLMTSVLTRPSNQPKRKRSHLDDDDNDIIIVSPVKTSETAETNSGAIGRHVTQTTRPLLEASTSKNARKSKYTYLARPWTCLVCTLDNEFEHLACAACAAPRGETTWTSV